MVDEDIGLEIDEDLESEGKGQSTQSQSSSGDSDSEEEEFFEIDPDWLPGRARRREMQIYRLKRKGVYKDKYLRLLHKLLMIAVYVDDLTATKLLCDSFMTNPFVRFVNGASAFLLAISMGRVPLVRFFLSQAYVYAHSRKKVKVKRLLNKAEKKGYNTGLHLSIANNRGKIMRLLIEKGVKTDKVNYMNWEPFEMSKHKQFALERKRLLREAEEREIISDESLFDPGKIPKTLYGGPNPRPSTRSTTT